MSPYKLLPAVAATLILVGCKTEIQTTVNLSDLLEGPSQILPGQLEMEVASCTDFQDTRKPSDSLLETQKLVPEIFAGSEFVECYRKQMDSLAVFNVPVYLTRGTPDNLSSEAHINLVANDDQLLGVAIPAPVRTRINDASKKMMGSDIQMRLAVEVINDLDRDFSFIALSTYVDTMPVVWSTLNAKAGTSFKLKLSDVSVDAAMEKGFTNVLIRTNDD